MRIKRWPALIVALGVGGTLLAPDDAGAGETHERVHALARGGARMLVVRSSPILAMPASAQLVGRPSQPIGPYEPAAKFDRTDPWTGEELTVEPIGRLAVDMIDPWNGEVIAVPGKSFAKLDTENPFDAN